MVFVFLVLLDFLSLFKALTSFFIFIIINMFFFIWIMAFKKLLGWSKLVVNENQDKIPPFFLNILFKAKDSNSGYLSFWVHLFILFILYSRKLGKKRYN
jgi:hypothetical protein